MSVEQQSVEQQSVDHPLDWRARARAEIEARLQRMTPEDINVLLGDLHRLRLATTFGPSAMEQRSPGRPDVAAIATRLLGGK